MTRSSVTRFVAGVCVILGPAVSAAAVPNVEVECGAVSGALDGGVFAYKGIPYAAPPTGGRRLRPPERPSDTGTCWSGVFDASNFGAQCTQLLEVLPVGVEDCLFINVWVPPVCLMGGGGGPAACPVAVFSHGGDLTMGDSSMYNMSALSAATGQVIASYNYRLGLLGFLALNALREGDPRGDTSGNYGLLDQQLALRWVQDNIAAFGGDKARVMVFGQSSGGTSVLAMLASPASRGLFSSAASLSGSPNMSMPLGVMETRNLPIVTAVGCGNATGSGVRACLQALPANAFPSSQPDSWAMNDQSGLPDNLNGENYPGFIVVDKITVVASLFDALAIPLIDVPLMIGAMAQEIDFAPNDYIYGTNASSFAALLSATFLPWGAAAAAAVGARYAADTAVDPQKAYDSMVADYAVYCGNLAAAHVAGQAFKSPVYVRSVVAGPSHAQSSFVPGRDIHYAYHMWDLLAGIEDYNMFGALVLSPWSPEPSDVAFGAVMRDHWSSFAATGHMSPSSNFAPVSSASGWPAHMAVGLVNSSGTRMVVDHKVDTCEFWMSLGIDARYWWAN